MADKNFKIWGIGYGLVGDIIMQLPLFTYFEKKYPGSYKYLVIEKKVSFCLNLFINHPLIDRIKVTNHWSNVGEEDLKLARECNIIDRALDLDKGIRKPPFKGKWHKDSHWYNHYNFIDEIAYIFGVNDLCNVLNEDERIPKLYKWFPSTSKNINAYTKEETSNESFKSNIAIWPYAGYVSGLGNRNASINWWKKLVSALINKGYTVSHFGIDNHIFSNNSNYKRYHGYNFFEQIKLSLLTGIAIGNDNGAMWAMAAYGHKCINLLTDYLPSYKDSEFSISPVGINTYSFFEYGSADNIRIEDILEKVVSWKQ